MAQLQLKGKWACVTGASSGIGEDIAEVLAMRGCNLVLVARRGEKLKEICERLQQKHGIQADWIARDLTLPNAARELMTELADKPIRVLINNAGFGQTGPFIQSDQAAMHRMFQLNMSALADLCYEGLATFEKTKEPCAIMNVGSIAGYQGVPHMAGYAATKAFVNHLSEGLAWEYHGTNISVTCLQPGKTESEFFDVADMRGSKFASGNVMSSMVVAQQGVDAMVQGKAKIVTGWANKISVFGLRLFPRFVVRMVISSMFKDYAR
jgi:short-subunit dehydrogenase